MLVLTPATHSRCACKIRCPMRVDFHGSWQIAFKQRRMLPNRDAIALQFLESVYNFYGNKAMVRRRLRSKDSGTKRYSDAILKLKESQASPGKSPYDQHVINEMLKVAYVRTGNYADAAKVMEAEIDDGFVPQSELQGLIRGLAQVNYLPLQAQPFAVIKLTELDDRNHVAPEIIGPAV